MKRNCLLSEKSSFLPCKCKSILLFLSERDSCTFVQLLSCTFYNKNKCGYPGESSLFYMKVQGDNMENSTICYGELWDEYENVA